MTERQAGQGIFRGWYVVSGSFTIMFLVFGAAYSFPAFFDELFLAFGQGSRGNVALIFSVSAFIFFFLGAVTGPLADKVDPRWIIGTGVVLTAAGLIVGSFATSLWQILLSYGLGVGLGVGFAYVPSVGPVQRWFVRRRGFASGMAVAGIGVGTFAAPLIATWLIRISDWRTAYLVMGIGILVAGVLATLLIVSGPEKLGLQPDGDPAPPPPANGEQSRSAFQGLGVKAALTTRPFILLYASSFIMSFPLFMPFVHLVPYALDQRINEVWAVTLASLIGIGSIAGRFLLGGIADRFGRRQSLIGTFVGLTFMFVLWALSEDYWLLAVFALIYGVCYGGFVALLPSVAVDYLGVKSAGGIIGVLYTSVAVGSALGPTFAGYAYDHFKAYTIPLAVAAAMMFLATLITFLLNDPAKWREHALGIRT